MIGGRIKFYSLLIGVLTVYSEISTGESAGDGCKTNPCGHGADCRTMANFAVICVCPEDTTGDPFVFCRKLPIAGSSSTSSTSGTMSTTASMSHKEPMSTSHISTSVSSMMGSTAALPSTIYSQNSAYPTSTVATQSDDSHNSYGGSSFPKSRDSYVTNDDMNRRNNVVVSSSSFDTNNDNYRLGVQPESNYGNMNRHQNVHHSPIAFNSRNEQNNYAVKDPMGVYTNCKSINNVIVCADESQSESDSSSNKHQNLPLRHSSVATSPNEYSHRSNFDGPSSPSGSSRHQEIVVSSQDSSTNIKSINGQAVPPPAPGDPGICKQFCGQNAVCRMLLGRPICGCPEGTTGDASVRCVPAEDQMQMNNRCHKHTDCSDTMVCEESQCVDPCNKLTISQSTSNNNNHHSMDPPALLRDQSSHHHRRTRGRRNGSMSDSNMSCGQNAKCHVIKHTQLCGCLDGFTGNPYNGCVASS